jgi:hypothetical protein
VIGIPWEDDRVSWERWVRKGQQLRHLQTFCSCCLWACHVCAWEGHCRRQRYLHLEIEGDWDEHSIQGLQGGTKIAGTGGDQGRMFNKAADSPLSSSGGAASSNSSSCLLSTTSSKWSLGDDMVRRGRLGQGKGRLGRVWMGEKEKRGRNRKLVGRLLI